MFIAGALNGMLALLTVSNPDSIVVVGPWLPERSTLLKFYKAAFIIDLHDNSDTKLAFSAVNYSGFVIITLGLNRLDTSVSVSIFLRYLHLCD